MTTLFKLLVTLPFLFALLWLTFANHESVQLSWSPLDEPASVPVSIIIVVSVSIGFLWGSMVTWLNGARTRQLNREKARTVRRLEKDLDAVRREGVPGAMTATPGLTHSGGRSIMSLPK